MENKINLVEILKDCPQGMELDCTICNSVKFRELDRNPNFPIVVRANNGYEFTLTKYGQVHNIDDAKCVIFPKGMTSWKAFVPSCKFKEGDVVTTRNGEYVFLLKNVISYGRDNVCYGRCYFGVGLKTKLFFDKEENWYFTRFATEEEKQKFFQAIKDNGYRWNDGTKSLEKLIEPTFKMGDIVKNKDNYIIVIVRVTDEYYTYINQKGERGILYIRYQNDWELVSNKFNINTLKPFDKVLVRHDRDNTWCASLFSHIGNNLSYCYKFVTTAGKSYQMCIPYKGNEHLLGTTNDCNDFYKIWE